jgi:hypothetical protein
MTPKHQRPDRRPWLVVAALGKGVGDETRCGGPQGGRSNLA